MSEILPKITAALTVSAIGAALLSVEGCDPGHHSESQQPSIARCYDTPRPPEYVQPTISDPHEPPRFSPHESFKKYEAAERRYEKASKRWRQSLDPYDLPTLKLRYISNDFVAGDPIYPGAKINETTKSIVEIDAKEWKGSGFLTTDSKGNQVVITAAHVVGNAALDGFTIETDNGRKTHPTGGCYIYEDNGKFADLGAASASDDERPVDEDIAVLTLPNPLSTQSLTISKKPVKRGEWTYFVNYQADSEPGYAADYTGVVASRPNDPLGYNIITGLARKKAPVTVSEVQADDIQAGASGGPILDAKTGEVIGVSTSGAKDGIFDDPETLKTLYDVQLQGSNLDFKHGIAPITAGAMSIRLIEQALHAPES